MKARSVYNCKAYLQNKNLNVLSDPKTKHGIENQVETFFSFFWLIII